MRIVSMVIFCLALVLAVTCSLPAQQLIPVSGKGEVRVIRDLSIATESIFDRENGISSNTVKSKTTNTLAKITDAVLVATMGNAYATNARETNQVAFDPFSNTTAVLYRGIDVDGTTVGNTLSYRWSSDHGATWSAEFKSINTGTENTQGKLRARHPSIIISNATKSTDRNNARVACVWPQLITSWGEAPFVSGVVNTSTFAKGKWAKAPSGADWFIPAHPFRDFTTGNLYAVSNTFDNSVSGGAVVYESYMMKSTNGGQTWTALPNPPLPDLLEKTPIILAGDCSVDGKTIHVGFLGATLLSGGSYNVFSQDHRLGLATSTDGGISWSFPEIFSIDQTQNVNVPIRPNPTVYATVDLVTDANGSPHFLSAISGDDYYPLDSTYVVEIVNENNNWKMYQVTKINQPWIPRFANPQNATSGPQPRYHIMSEVNWGKSVDGNKLYAKWIDCDSTIKFVTRDQNGNALYALDSIHNIWASGKDIRSKTFNGGWINPIKITNTQNVDEKQTKMNVYIGDDGKLDIIYTIWATGDFRDDDDLGQANVYMVTKVDGAPAQGVALQIPVGVNDKVEKIPTSYTLEQNFPNPFNPTTSISFSLPVSGKVKLRVFDLLGKEITSLVDGNFEAGTHKVTFDASNIPSGMYLYRLESGSYIATKKMTVLR